MPPTRPRARAGKLGVAEAGKLCCTHAQNTQPPTRSQNSPRGPRARRRCQRIGSSSCTWAARLGGPHYTPLTRCSCWDRWEGWVLRTAACRRSTAPRRCILVLRRGAGVAHTANGDSASNTQTCTTSTLIGATLYGQEVAHKFSAHARPHMHACAWRPREPIAPKLCSCAAQGMRSSECREKNPATIIETAPFPHKKTARDGRPLSPKREAGSDAQRAPGLMRS